MFLLRLIAPLLLAVLGWWGLQRIRQRYSLTPSQFRWLVAAAALLMVVLVLIVVGRLPVQALAAPLVFLLTFAMRNIGLLAQLWSWRRSRTDNGGGARPRGAGVSSISTPWLAMELTHRTGVMDGEVLKGSYQGVRLSALTLNDLLVLASECLADEDSLRLLEAYLDRSHPDWREHASGSDHNGQGQPGDDGARRDGSAGPSAATQSMTRSLALEILGLDAGASREEIVAAHRRLMQKMHPDRGGSDYLAQRINEARDYLLRRSSRH